MLYVVQVCRQLSSRTRILHPGPAKFVKLVHLVGFVTKKYILALASFIHIRDISAFRCVVDV